MLVPSCAVRNDDPSDTVEKGFMLMLGKLKPIKGALLIFTCSIQIEIETVRTVSSDAESLEHRFKDNFTG